MNKRKLLTSIALTAALALTASSAGAQTRISPAVIGSGATTASGAGGTVLKGTVGQTVIGPVGGSTGRALQGFWYMRSVETVPTSVPFEYVAGESDQEMRSWPNPFSSETELRVTLAAGPATLKLYNALGREVETLLDGTYEAGTLSIRIDGESLESGTYIAQLIAGGRQQSMRLVVVR